MSVVPALVQQSRRRPPERLMASGNRPGAGYTRDETNTGEAHSAWIHDYILGGKSHYPADR
ncbi:SAM-dependent methyltransferase [Streptomyces oceani]|uniref:SAM-dependent methyltransferase n=1 Tax=Streptomyces oceani TaxID=1075402 RepID=UPI000D1B4569